MTIQELGYFLEVARVESIGQAGVNLFVSPQAVSKGIKNLENSLGYKLFSRNSKGVKLTAFGEAFLQEVLPIMQSINEVSNFGREYQAASSSSVVIYLDTINSYSYLIHQFTQEYGRNHPENSIRMESHRILTAEPLLTDKCDVMFLCNRPGLLNAQNCDCFTLFTSKTVAIANIHNPISKTPLLHWSSFSKIPIYLRSEEVYYAQSIINKCVSSGFYPHLGYRGNNMLDPFYFTYYDDGVAFVPDFVAEFFLHQSSELCILDFETGIMTEYIFAVRKDRKIEIFPSYIDFIYRKLKQHGLGLLPEL